LEVYRLLVSLEKGLPIRLAEFFILEDIFDWKLPSLFLIKDVLQTSKSHFQLFPRKTGRKVMTEVNQVLKLAQNPKYLQTVFLDKQVFLFQVSQPFFIRQL